MNDYGGIGYTKEFKLYDPLLKSIEVVNKGQGYGGRKRRRSKLYYLKDKPVALYQVKYKDNEGRVGPEMKR